MLYPINVQNHTFADTTRNPVSEFNSSAGVADYFLFVLGHLARNRLTVSAGEDFRQNRQLRTRLLLGAKVALASCQAL
jgi:hypothetical protein